MSRDHRIDQSATSIQSLLNTNGPSFLMTSHKIGPLDFTINMQHSLSFFVGSQTQMNENGNVPSETVSTHCDSGTYLLSVLYYALLLFSRRR